MRIRVFACIIDHKLSDNRLFNKIALYKLEIKFTISFTNRFHSLVLRPSIVSRILDIHYSGKNTYGVGSIFLW